MLISCCRYCGKNSLSIRSDVTRQETWRLFELWSVLRSFLGQMFIKCLFVQRRERVHVICERASSDSKKEAFPILREKVKFKSVMTTGNVYDSP